MIKYSFKTCEIVLSFLFILFLVLGIEDNYKMAKIVSIPQIKIVIVVLALILFFNCNRILGILSIFVAYELLNFSHAMMNKSLENVEYEYEMKPNPSPLSMEEELIYKMNPVFNCSMTACSYNPIKSASNIFFF
jgi:hypothetical protein